MTIKYDYSKLGVLSDRQLRTLISKATSEAQRRSREKSMRKLRGSLTEIPREQFWRSLGRWTDAAYETSNAQDRKFKKGYFHSSRGGVYAMTASGIIYTFKMSARRWEKV